MPFVSRHQYRQLYPWQKHSHGSAVLVRNQSALAAQEMAHVEFGLIQVPDSIFTGNQLVFLSFNLWKHKPRPMPMFPAALETWRDPFRFPTTRAIFLHRQSRRCRDQDFQLSAPFLRA